MTEPTNKTTEAQPEAQQAPETAGTEPVVPVPPVAPGSEQEAQPHQPAQPGPQPPATPPNYWGSGPESFNPWQQAPTGPAPRITAGNKALWAVMGFMLGIFSFPLVFFIYMSRDRRILFEAMRWCLFGFVLSVVASALLMNYLLTDPTALQMMQEMGISSTLSTSTSTAPGGTDSLF